MVLSENLLTVDEFKKIAQRPENKNRQFELENGMMVEIPTPSSKAKLIVSHLFFHIHTPSSKGTLTSSFRINNYTLRRPDLAFVPIEQLSDLKPTFVVEIVTHDEDVFKKIVEYFDCGAKLIWTIYCDEQKIFVSTRDTSGVIHTETKSKNDTLDGGDALPDFRLPVTAIFPPNLK